MSHTKCPQIRGSKMGCFRGFVSYILPKGAFSGNFGTKPQKNLIFLSPHTRVYVSRHHTMLFRRSTSSRSPANNKKVEISTCKFILIFSFVYCLRLLRWAHLHLQYFILARCSSLNKALTSIFTICALKGGDAFRLLHSNISSSRLCA